MELTITQNAGTLTLAGSLDLVSRQEFLYAGLTALEQHDALSLDLGGVDFMDSMGIGALVELARHAEKREAPLTIVAASPRVSRVLEMTGLSDVWRAV